MTRKVPITVYAESLSHLATYVHPLAIYSLTYLNNFEKGQTQNKSTLNSNPTKHLPKHDEKSISKLPDNKEPTKNKRGEPKKLRQVEEEEGKREGATVRIVQSKLELIPKTGTEAEIDMLMLGILEKTE